MLRTLTMPDYLAAEGISKSGLDQLAKSPAHYQAWLKEKPEPTPAMVFGSALHCALLEPQRFQNAYVQAPDIGRRSNADKAKYLEWEQANVGRIPLSVDHMVTIKGMQDAFQSHPLVSGVLRGALIEQCAFWRDEETNVLCKSRPDIVVSGLIVDVKTTEDASAQEFAKSAARYRYHVQAAMYLAGVNATIGGRHDFLFVAIEKKPPYAISVFSCDAQFLNIGRDSFRHGLIQYAECVRSNNWPSYPAEVQPLTLPSWALKEPSHASF